MDNNKGRVFWITGLSGAGKTTIGGLLYKRILIDKEYAILWDGDAVREAFKEPYDMKYDYESRKKGAFRDARVIKMISDQGIDVVICTIAMIHEIQEWNRENIENYFEIFLDCPMQVLLERDQKRLYSEALNGSTINVVGVDIEPEFPRCPDIKVINDGSRDPVEICDYIMKKLNKLSQDE